MHFTINGKERVEMKCGTCWHYHGIYTDEDGLHEDRESPEGFCSHPDACELTQSWYSDCTMWEEAQCLQ